MKVLEISFLAVMDEELVTSWDWAFSVELHLVDDNITLA